MGFANGEAGEYELLHQRNPFIIPRIIGGKYSFVLCLELNLLLLQRRV